MIAPLLGFFILALSHHESSAVVTRTKLLLPTVKQGQVRRANFLFSQCTPVETEWPKVSHSPLLTLENVTRNGKAAIKRKDPLE